MVKKVKKDHFVVYQSVDETLITLASKEDQFLKDWFGGTGRQLLDYDRDETDDTIQVTSTPSVYH